MISLGRFILQNESLKRVYFLLPVKSEISGKLSVRRSISIVFAKKKYESTLANVFLAFSVSSGFIYCVDLLFQEQALLLRFSGGANKKITVPQVM